MDVCNMCGGRFSQLEAHQEEHRQGKFPVISAGLAFEKAFGRKPEPVEVERFVEGKMPDALLLKD